MILPSKVYYILNNQKFKIIQNTTIILTNFTIKYIYCVTILLNNLT